MEQITYRGLVLDGPYMVTRVEGLDGAEVRTDADTHIPRGDGHLPGSHWLDARRITLTVRVVGRERLPTLMAAFRPARNVEPALSWTEDDGTSRRVYCRPVQTIATVSGGMVVDLPIGLKASDPRIYGPSRSALVNPWQPSQEGIDYPKAEYPINWPPAVGTQAVVRNGGDSDAYPTVRIRGPQVGQLESWRLANLTTGAQLQVDTTVGPGQLLTVRMREWVVGDPSALIVDLDGQSRYGGWVSRPEPFWLAPGDNVLRLTTLSGADPSSAELIWRDTYGGTRRDDEGQS